MANMNTPNLDALDHATLAHLCAWLDYTTDAMSRGKTQDAIEAGLSDYPESIESGLTWQEIARRGE